MFAGKKSAQIREILISESAWEEMTCLFAPSLGVSVEEIRQATEKFWPTATITKSKEGSHPSSGLEERLKQLLAKKGKQPNAIWNISNYERE